MSCPRRRDAHRIVHLIIGGARPAVAAATPRIRDGWRQPSRRSGDIHRGARTPRRTWGASLTRTNTRPPRFAPYDASTVRRPRDARRDLPAVLYRPPGDQAMPAVSRAD